MVHSIGIQLPMIDRRDASTPTETSLIGRVVGGKYRVDALLGVGGMGAVYAAVQTNLDRRVALKVMHPERMHVATSRERFKREALAIARLHHPNIVAVFDFDVEAETGAYLVMEHIAGSTLHEEIRRCERLPLDVVCTLFEPICSAIAAAHANGVLHRDIKPQNILLDQVGGQLVPKVVDFGLASIADSDRGDATALTRAGAFMGTPLYMAPEQCDDKPLDARSDVYSLGCVLYEMLTGNPPFTGLSLGALLIKHSQEAPVAPSKHVVGLPELVDRVVLRALAKVPDERFQSPEDLAQALLAAASPEQWGATSHHLVPEPTINLPRNITTFVGRSDDTADVVALVRSERLVTLSGPGGIGKSRLAHEVATALSMEFPYGVWWVDLTPVTLPGLVPLTVADALGIRAEGNRPVMEALCERLAAQRILIVLDGCEHVLEACSLLADAFLRRCAGPTIVATSQAALNIPGERVWAVPALSLPEVTHARSVEEALSCDAVRLFVERVRLQLPAFEVTTTNVSAVVQLCARLEGLPLAIELAAARTRVLSVEQILTKMDDRFRLLTGGVRNRPQRQQTLRAAIDWSHELLDEAERALFRRLAIFVGGASLEAVEAVCSPLASGSGSLEADVLDVLARLVDRSLVGVGRSDAEPRYRMLETLRHYAVERLEQAGEEGKLHARHFEWCLDLSKDAGARLRPKVHESVLAEVEREYGNIRAALQWSIQKGNRAADALTLSVALMPFWEVRGYSGEGRRWLSDALAAARDAEPELRVRALHAAGTLSHNVGDYDRARALYDECVTLERLTGDDIGQAQTLRRLGDVFVRLGRYDEAMACQTKSLEVSRKLGDERATALALSQMGMVGICLEKLQTASDWYAESLAIFRKLDQRLNVAVVLHNLAELKHRLGDSDDAIDLLDQCLTIARELGYKGLVGTSLIVRASIDADRGDAIAAEAAAREAMTIVRALGDKLGTSYAIDAFVRHAVLSGKPERALRLAGSAGAIRAGLGSVLSPYERATLDRYLDAARCELGEVDAARALDVGSRMTSDAAIALALSDE
jgi:predicted ATPase/serine/threonine protein kinase